MMKALALTLSVATACLLCAACGSLDRNISSTQLSKEDMAYISSVPDGNGDVMLQSSADRMSGSQSSSVFYPTFPWLQGKCFFKDSKGEGYGLISFYAFMPVVPLFLAFDGTVYDEDGGGISNLHSNSVPILYSYVERNGDLTDYHSSKDWQFDFLAFPYINGFIGFGSDYLQLLWIPISRDRLREKTDFSYSPGNDF